MLILAIETTADLCSIALRDDQGTLAERAFRHRMHLSERLIDDVDAVLADGGVTLAEIDGFGVGVGPGSFTGVRVGVMTVKTWADVLGKPVCAVSSLEALAWACAGDPGLLIAPVVRARPGSVYLAVYRAVGEGIERVIAPEMCAVEAVGERLREIGASRILFCGEGAHKLRAALVESASGAGIEALFGSGAPPRASTIAAVAARRLAMGEADDALKLAPLYIAPPPIDPRVEKRNNLPVSR